MMMKRRGVSNEREGECCYVIMREEKRRHSAATTASLAEVWAGLYIV